MWRKLAAARFCPRLGKPWLAAMMMALLAFSATACDTDPLGHGIAAAAPVSGRDYRLGTGDRIQINVFAAQDLNGAHDIDGAGMITFPLIGQIYASGLTLKELENTIASRLNPGFVKNPNVTAEIVRYRPFYIVGEVKNPGSYPYVPGMMVINGIALAGGFTYRASENSFQVTRPEANGEADRLTATQESPIQPGDVITVRERYF